MKRITFKSNHIVEGKMKSNIKKTKRNTLAPPPPRTIERLAYGKELLIEKNEYPNTPFNVAEEHIMQIIVEAHNEFIGLERMHPMEMQEWVQAIHQLQSILSHRAMKRLFPNYFK